jgi:hypothetical protein
MRRAGVCWLLLIWLHVAGVACWAQGSSAPTPNTQRQTPIASWAQGSWTPVAVTMGTPRDAHSALLVGGQVLLFGGRTRPEGATTATIERFDPVQQTVAPAGEMAGSRSFCPALLLPSGHILLPGGFRQLQHDTTIRASELYDVRRQRCRRIGDLGTARELHTATELPDHSVLIAGGFSNGALLDTAELYLPRRRRFASTGKLHASRFGHTATLLADGLLVCGGRTAKDVSLRTTEVYNPQSRTWAFGPTLVQDRFRHTATLLKDGSLLITGGYSSVQRKTLATAERYDPATGLFTLLSSTMTDGRMDHTATLLADGRVLITGGWSSSLGRTVATADIFDPATNAFTPAAPLPVSRHEHSATLLPDGSVLVSGGLSVEPHRQRTLDDLVIFRP